jgi:hypothetical protein
VLPLSLPPELDPKGDHDEPKLELELDSDAGGLEVAPADPEADFLRPPDFRAFDFLALDFFADFLAPDFLAPPLFAADLFFFRAGAAFLPPFDFLDFAFDLRFFAIIVLPMVGQPQDSCRHGSDPCLQCRRHPSPGRPVDQLDGVDHRD